MATFNELFKGRREFTDTTHLCPTDLDTNERRIQIVGAMQLEDKKPSAPEPPKEQYMSQKNVLGPENSVTTCQFCHASIRTAIKHTVTSRTHIAAALCGLICCCCCIPFCCDSAKNTDHYCPACKRYLGTYVK